VPERPTGTVTFLFTDVEGSTKLWEKHPAAMKVRGIERVAELLCLSPHLIATARRSPNERSR
jgi:class 3 adenylate cyclase